MSPRLAEAKYACVFFLVLAPLMTSCVVSHQIVPTAASDLDQFSKKNSSIFYDVKPVSNPMPGMPYVEYLLAPLYVDPFVWYGYPLLVSPPPLWNPWGKLERVVAEHFLKATNTPTPPEQGIYFSVNSASIESSAIAKIFGHAFVYLLCILPYYSGGGGMVVRYDLYIDQDLKKQYRYEIRKKGVGWLLLLPFAWINLFTDDLEDALASTAYQFFLDAERDGYLKPDEMNQPVLSAPTSSEPMQPR